MKRKHYIQYRQIPFLRKSLVLLFFVGLYTIANISAKDLDAIGQGQVLFNQHRYKEALPFFERAHRADRQNNELIQYIGIIHLIDKNWDRAIEIYSASLATAGKYAPLFLYNMGNAYYSKGVKSLAIEYYSQALDKNPALSQALLNRANARLDSEDFALALADYEYFLDLEPNDPQASKILRMIGLLEDELDEQERAIAAQKAKKEAEEARARQEAERRRQIMADLESSLFEAAQDTLGVSAGSEAIQDYEGEFELE